MSWLWWWVLHASNQSADVQETGHIPLYLCVQ